MDRNQRRVSASSIPINCSSAIVTSSSALSNTHPPPGGAGMLTSPPAVLHHSISAPVTLMLTTNSSSRAEVKRLIHSGASSASLRKNSAIEKANIVPLVRHNSLPKTTPGNLRQNHPIVNLGGQSHSQMAANVPQNPSLKRLIMQSCDSEFSQPVMTKQTSVEDSRHSMEEEKIQQLRNVSAINLVICHVYIS